MKSKSLHLSFILITLHRNDSEEDKQLDYYFVVLMKLTDSFQLTMSTTAYLNNLFFSITLLLFFPPSRIVPFLSQQWIPFNNRMFQVFRDICF